MRKYGIDISHHQGSIDFSKLNALLAKKAKDFYELNKTNTKEQNP